MAVAGVCIWSRLRFQTEFKHVFRLSAIHHKTRHIDNVQNVLRLRLFTTTVPLLHKDKPAKSSSHTTTTSSSSSESESESDKEDDDNAVTISYFRGLPQVTVPLPSRRERCRFTLRPVSNTVGDFISMLKLEDKGIDRVAFTAKDETRIASSNSISALLEDDFNMVINDRVYEVEAPKEDKLTTEEIRRLSDVKSLVNQLYEVLNVQEHQIYKERQLTAELEDLKLQLQPLEELKISLESQAARRTNWLSWAGLGLMSVQFGILARLTWWEYSWDIMEPVTYFVTYGTAMAAYAYFVLTKQEYILPDVKNRQHLITIHRRSKQVGLDLLTYNQLRDEIALRERDLKKLRDPLRLQVPLKGQKTAAAEGAAAPPNTSKMTVCTGVEKKV